MVIITRFVFLLCVVTTLAGCSTGFERGSSGNIFNTTEVTSHHNKPMISRSVGKISLGMPTSELSKLYNKHKVPDPTISLYMSFAPEIATNKIKMNNEFKTQYFDLFGNLPEGVSTARAVCSADSLYEIALYYGEEYTRKVDWEEFVSVAFQKYGQPSFMYGPSSYKWEDSRTRLEIAKVLIKYKKSNKQTTQYNVFYTDIPTSDKLKNREESWNRQQKSLPNF